MTVFWISLYLLVIISYFLHLWVVIFIAWFLSLSYIYKFAFPSLDYNVLPLFIFLVYIIILYHYLLTFTNHYQYYIELYILIEFDSVALYQIHQLSLQYSWTILLMFSWSIILGKYTYIQLVHWKIINLDL